ncbi:PRC-barrel domain-containing protein [Celeribacter naphthalenivorans]|uniref:PRC-barrel domain-containing protein n=1 Tax=Celeribacter naphthalenivorans TaxID=1614694 RepID=UPI001CFA49A6|nr:PRC-barrel domain-containing protein [Celeribacter naphthalenivorans]
MKTLTQKLMTTAAVIGLAATPVFAEMTSETDATVSEDGVTMQSDTSMEAPAVDDAMESADGTMDNAVDGAEDTASDVADATADTANEAWDATQEGAQNVAAALETFGQETVSEIVGTQVLTESGEDIGEIDAIVMAEGETKAIVGVGGFLGIAEHDVLVEIDQFSMIDENSVMIQGATEEELKAMPDVNLADYEEVEGDLTLEQAMNS